MATVKTNRRRVKTKVKRARLTPAQKEFAEKFARKIAKLVRLDKLEDPFTGKTGETEDVKARFVLRRVVYEYVMLFGGRRWITRKVAEEITTGAVYRVIEQLREEITQDFYYKEDDIKP